MKYHERLANKLNDPKTAPKTYWVILKTFLNGSKIPLIPPLVVDNKLVTGFLDKANPFNNFFAKQCTPISNDSTVPVSINFVTMERLSSLEFCVDDIAKIIFNTHDKTLCLLNIETITSDFQELSHHFPKKLNQFNIQWNFPKADILQSGRLSKTDKKFSPGRIPK